MNGIQYQVMSINVPFTFGSFLPFSSILETKLVKYGQLRHYSWLFYIYSSFSDRKIYNFTYFLPNRIYYQWDFYLDEKKKWFNVFFDMKSMFNQLFYGEDFEFFNNKKNEKWDIQWKLSKLESCINQTTNKVLMQEIFVNLRGYHTLQGYNSLKSVERFDHMMFVCRFQASRWSKPQREKLLCG